MAHDPHCTCNDCLHDHQVSLGQEPPRPRARHISRPPTTPASDLVAEASDLNFKPGLWPETVTHAGVVWTMGKVTIDGDGDLCCVTYKAGDRKMVVFND